MMYFEDIDFEVHLKVLAGREDAYDRRICAVSDCTKPSRVIDDTRRLAACAVPLCEEHWEQRCEAEELTFGRFTVLTGPGR